jgi:Kef-type K+ transport system membrane component KefB
VGVWAKLRRFDFEHWLLLVVAVVTILGPQVAAALGALNLSKASAVVVGAIGFATSVRMLIKQFDEMKVVEGGTPP